MKVAEEYADYRKKGEVPDLVLVVTSLESLFSCASAYVITTSIEEMFLLSFLHFHYVLMPGCSLASNVVSYAFTFNIFFRSFCVCEPKGCYVSKYRIASENVIKNIDKKAFRHFLSAEDKLKSCIKDRIYQSVLRSMFVVKLMIIHFIHGMLVLHANLITKIHICNKLSKFAGATV